MRRPTLWLLHGLASIVVIAGTTGAHGNLIADGGFETPLTTVGSYTVYGTGQTFGPWTVLCPTCGTSGNVAIVSTTFSQNGFNFVAQSGNQWLDLTGLANQRVEVAQTIATVTGQMYSLSFYIGNVVDQTSTFFGTKSDLGVSISHPNSLSLIQTFTNSNSSGAQQNWTQYTLDFTAGGDATTIGFYNFDPTSDNSNGLDGIDVEAIGPVITSVPEPDSLALVAIGAMLLGIVRRRRTKARRA